MAVPFDPFIVLLLFILLVGAFVFYFYVAKKGARPSLEEVIPPHFVSVDGFLIHYQQLGKGPDLLLVHGIGASQFCWRFVAPKLAEHFRVTLVDLPGFGRSSKRVDKSYGLDDQAQRLWDLCDQLGIGQTHLVGCSMGGALVLWMAKLKPERTLGVVGLAPATNHLSLPLSVNRLSFLSPALSLVVGKVLVQSILARIYADQSLIDESIVNQYLAPYRNDPVAVKVFLKATQLIMDPRLPEDLKDITTPILLLWGSRDRIVPLKWGQKLLTFLPHAELREISLGHHLMEENPDWTCQQIIQFFGTRLS